MSEWQPANKPPQVMGTYLICTKYGQVQTCFYNIVRGNTEPPFWMGFRGDSDCVAAWMPIPAPPPEYQHFVAARIRELRDSGHGEHAN